MSDVFLASAIEDQEMADLVARRLKSLKLGLAYDSNRVERHAPETFSDVEKGFVNDAKVVLVLWSRAAKISSWVNTAFEAAHADDKVIVAVLDDSRLAGPLKDLPSYRIKELSARKKPQDWVNCVDVLGEAVGRSGLGDWLSISARDADARAEWMKAHPKDPLSGTSKKTTVKKGTSARKNPPKAPPRPTPQRAVAKPVTPGEKIVAPEARKSWAGPWRLEDATGLPFGVEDKLTLLSGVSDSISNKMRRNGLSSLRKLATYTQDQAEVLEKAAGLTPGFIGDHDLVVQARELLNGKEPRAKIDLDDWRIMQLEAYKARFPNPDAMVKRPTSGNGVQMPNVMAKIGTVPAIGVAIVAMLFLAWMFGQDERTRQSQLVQTPTTAVSQ